MSTRQDLENAPIGATASSTETNARYIKTSDRWLLFDGRGDSWVDEYDLASESFTLDPLHTGRAADDLQLQTLTLWTVPDLVEAIAHGRVHIAPGHDPALTAPTSAREALDLAWNLAHEVKEGQVIPAGTGLLLREEYGLLREDEALENWEPITEPTDDIRTLDPLPEPEPDWLDAPVVIAQVDECPWQTLWLPRPDGHWACTECGDDRHWNELQEVTPLYPKDTDQ